MSNKKNSNEILKLKNEELSWIASYKQSRINKILDSMHDFVISKNKKLEKTKLENKKLLEKTKLKNKKLLEKIKLKDNKEKINAIIENNELKIKAIIESNELKIKAIIENNELTINKKEINSRNKIKKIENYFSSYSKKIKKIDDKKEDIISFKSKQLLRPVKLIPLFWSFLKKLNENKLLIFIAIVTIFAGMTINVFFTKKNIFTNILKNNAEVGILAVGMTFVILTGGIDLSVGSLLGMSGILAAKGYVVDGYSLGLSLFISFLVTLSLGIFQGLLISKIKLPPFIVTLVGLLAFRGIARIVAASRTFSIETSHMTNLNIGEFIGVPYLVWVLMGFTFLGMFILKFTKFGRKVYAVGGNIEAARLSGIKTSRIILFVYVIMAFSVFLATISFTSRVGSFEPLTGTSMELDVISAVVLGGTSLIGGRGGVGKTIIGWLVISTLSNVLTLLGYKQDWQLVFKGLIILAAVILDKDLKIVWRIKKILKNII